MAEKKNLQQPLPPITLPPRTGIDTFFSGGLGASPGPMTLVSSFFASNDPDGDCRSFSQLLAGTTNSSSSAINGFNVSEEQRIQTPPEMFPIPSGINLANLLDSSRSSFDSSQAAFGALHQRFQFHDDSAHQSLSAAPPPSTLSMQQQIPAPVQDQQLLQESYEISFSDRKSRHSNMIVDKPTDDGYNWRKYGQKQVKGGEFPRSYYKCTHSHCPVKKKVERSLDGQITEIIYRGQHNHSPPSKRTAHTNEASNSQGNSGFGGSETQSGNMNKLIEEVSYLSSSIRGPDQSYLKPEQVSGSSDSEEVDDTETRVNGRNEAEPESKRRIVGAQNTAQASSHRTVTEPRIIVQTTSEIDLLDDGYRWRKYGQKVVKGNPYPRSYYKCTYQGCSIRKHVERAAADPKAVITTYEGKHNHDVPPLKGSSFHVHSNGSSQIKSNYPVVDRPVSNTRTDFGNKEQQPVGLRFKEEQHIT